jgi:4,5-DOPA dioxygenase extradiol
MNRKQFLKTLAVMPLSHIVMNVNELNKISDSFSPTPTMPVLFLGHGSPMNAIEENEFVQGFRNVAKTIPKPNAILCISAHWLTHGTMVTAMEYPRTIHDFGGFPKALFDVQYPAKGSSELAHETKAAITTTEVGFDEKWGLDHGAWSVIKHLYPQADVPVVQMSIDYYQPAQYHFELAKQLASLRRKGILIIGSGNIIHNLRLADFANIYKDNYGYDWAIEARAKMNKWLLDGDFKALMDYEKAGKAVQLSIPSPDHYFPLIYALGLKETTDTITLFNDKLVGGSLSMTSVKIA